MDWNKNLGRVLPFLSDRQADVVCLQEVREDALPVIAEAAGNYYFYAPMCGGKIHGAPSTVGIAIFSRLPLLQTKARYYVGAAHRIVELDEQTLESRRATTYRALAFGGVQRGDTVYRIVTTHFTWTPDGKADEFQRHDLQKMLGLLQKEGEYLLCGDFNAPRGGEIYKTLSQKLKDNVPAHYVTSIDPERHRIKGLKSMVDGLFTTSGYVVSDVRLHFGVSDHGALEAVVSRE
ncbi:endonuclease/exonuclease/phosphatase family protein [Candidatus Kaiserbacteria bacterium]|nr:endonuclease/exonuclease/phosphatase family protein [Candidatus Kaiserbacteria bacterium]